MKVCLVTSGRSGSELLTKFFINHPDFAAISEPYNKKTLTKNRDKHLVSLYAQYLDVYEDQLDPEPSYIPQLRNTKFLSMLYENFDYTKILYDHITPAMESWIKKNCQVIHLVRNPLHRMVSLKVALQTQIWHTRPDAEPNTETNVEINLQGLQKKIDSDAWFREKWATAYQVKYEDLCENWGEVTHNIQKYLGVKIPRYIEKPLKKTVARPLEEVITNIDEIRNTEYSKYL